MIWTSNNKDNNDIRLLSTKGKNIIKSTASNKFVFRV